MTLDARIMWIATRHCTDSSCHKEMPCRRCHHLAAAILELYNEKKCAHQVAKEFLDSANLDTQEGKPTV